MAAPYYLAIHGRLVVVGKEPEGDSVRFIADHPEHYASSRMPTASTLPPTAACGCA